MVMISLISFMFALDTFLWVAWLEDDIVVMVEMSKGNFRVDTNSINASRLLANAIALINVSE
jgi:hypothetical protein